LVFYRKHTTHTNLDAELAIGTLLGTARTVMLASALKLVLVSAFNYAAVI
jgi:hypothetical protein